jgi:hypothetical protein
MLRTHVRTALVSALLSVVPFAPLLEPTANAQGNAPTSPAPATDRAAQLKVAGDAAMETLRYADALGAYAQAYALSKDPALLYNQGRAQQALGNFPEALSDLERFAQQAPPELRARVPKLDELVADVRKHVAHLAIRCQTRGARVLVRERVAGTTPLAAPLDVDAGFAHIEIDAEGYEPYRRDVDLPGAMQTVLDVELVPRKLTAFLRVSSTAASAIVSIDGTPVGNAPVEQIVTPGTHTVGVHRDGYEDTESSVVLAIGEHKELSLDPQRNPPVYAKWWFWTGVGVVVAGGVVTTAALLLDKPASKGDGFSPSQVSAPLTRF